mgnify:FL=1
MFYKSHRYLFAILYYFSVTLIGQTLRDEVIQINSPDDGAVISDNYLVVLFDVAEFFQIGQEQCNNCDGYLKVSLDENLIGTITSGSQSDYTITGIAAGMHFLQIEAVRPSGESFVPVVRDTVSFSYGNVEGCPVEVLTVFGGDEENILSWTEPSGGVGCGDIVVPSLPFSDSGTNEGAGDQWPVSGGTSQGDDVSYTLNINSPTTITVDLCSESTDYDTKLEIFTIDDDCLVPVSTGFYDDDGPFNTCPSSPAPYTPSILEDVSLQPGRYYIVVDGYGGATGNYAINISTSDRGEFFSNQNTIKTEWPLEQLKMSNEGYSGQEITDITTEVLNSYRQQNQTYNRDVPVECGVFLTYRIYDSFTGTVIHETSNLSWSHGPLVNGTERCYYVTAVYQQGETIVSSNVACGNPESFLAPSPTNVSVTPLDEEVLVFWTESNISQLEIPYTETFDEDSGLIDLWLINGDNWVVSPFGNPAPSMEFTWQPAQENYDQALFSPSIPLGSITSVILSFDIFFEDYPAAVQNEEYLTFEYLYNGVWTEIETWRADSSISWTNYTQTLENLSGLLQVRFRAYGINSFDINYWLIDNFQVNNASRIEYDFSGYNVYYGTDISNLQLFNTDAVLTETDVYVTGLNNGLEYHFGVRSVHEGEPQYLSDLISATATPIWLYGDINGVVTDPAGNPLDSVVVSADGFFDTTGSDGIYSIMNLNPGAQKISANKEGFFTDDYQVEIFAREESVQQDIAMAPILPNPICLTSEAGDNNVQMSWLAPNSDPCGDWIYYHDGEFEDAYVSNNGGAGPATLFIPSSYPATIMSVRFHITDADVAQGIELNVYSVDQNALGPSLISGPYAVSAVADGWIEIDIDDASINSGGFLVATYNTSANGPYFSVDINNYNGSLYFGNAEGFVEMGGYGIYNVGSHEAFISESGSRTFADQRFQDIFNTGSNLSFEELDIVISGSHGPSEPRMIESSGRDTRLDSLVGYHVYQIDEEGSDIFILETADTSATVPVDSNYQEYCHYVKAVWQTEYYGNIESPSSNTTCSTPYTIGDWNFDSNVDINDVLSVVDCILEEEIPTDEQLKNIDLNDDGNINIADIIMMVDIIFNNNSAGRLSSKNDAALVYLGLENDYKKSQLNLNIEYDGELRGIQFELNYDPTRLDLGTPKLRNNEQETVVFYKVLEPGLLKVIIIDLTGGKFKSLEKPLMYLPVELKGELIGSTNIEMNSVSIVGSRGEVMNYVLKISPFFMSQIPSTYALHQNYPNPFNPKTEIRFDIIEESDVKLTIYNLMGQKIKDLKSERMIPGFHAVSWNGTNSLGAPVASGMYLYKLSTETFQSTKKMLFLK